MVVFMNPSENITVQFISPDLSPCEVTLQPIGKKDENSITINRRSYSVKGSEKNVAVFLEQLKKLPSKDFPSLIAFKASIERHEKALVSSTKTVVSAVLHQSQAQQFVEKILHCNGSKQEIMEIFSNIPSDLKKSAFLLDIALTLAEKGSAIKANHFFSLIPDLGGPEEMDSAFFRMGQALLKKGEHTSNVDSLNCAYEYLSRIKFYSPSPPKELQEHIDKIQGCLKKLSTNVGFPQKTQAAEIFDCIQVKELLGKPKLVKSAEELEKLRSADPTVNKAFEKAKEIQTRADTEPLPAPPGKIITIKTKEGESIGMHVNVTGTRRKGEPLVILEGGLGMISSDWQHVQKGLPKDIQVMSYDREGTGWSGKRKELNPTSENSLANLEEILKSKGLEGPYIFVGHSYGGFLGQFFTLRHSDQVAGLVLVDSAIEGHPTGPDPEKQTTFDYIPAIAQNTQFGNDVAHFLDEESSATVHRIKSRSSNEETYKKEVAGFMKSGELLKAELAKAGTPPYSCRMKVITGTKENIMSEEIQDEERWKHWQEKQHELPQRSSQTEKIILAEKSDHFPMYHQPKLIIGQICDFFV
jgi:pimeloyl-ACP methyl ester carboxylesterase